MKIQFHKDFKKRYKNLKSGKRKKFHERLAMFEKDMFDPILNNHALKGKYEGYRSINITGDLRAIYRHKGSGDYIFANIGTHPQPYN